ncbi:MAG: hypothetical protein ABIL22_04300 [candidate division WOR-3 bacterium]
MIVLFLFNIFENFLYPDFALNTTQFNPANLIEQRFFVSLGGNEKFGLQELRTWTAQMQIHSFRLRFRTFGNELYKENCFEFAGGFLLYRALGAGIGIGLLNNWIKDYTNRFGYTIKFGGVFELSDLKFDLCLNNVNYPRFSEIDYLPLSYVLGIQYKINAYLNPYFYTMGKETDRPFFNFGLLTMPTKEIECYTGLNTENFVLEYGFRIFLRRLALEYAGSSHRQLGLSHGFFIYFIGQ